MHTVSGTCLHTYTHLAFHTCSHTYFQAGSNACPHQGTDPNMPALLLTLIFFPCTGSHRPTDMMQVCLHTRAQSCLHTRKSSPSHPACTNGSVSKMWLLNPCHQTHLSPLPVPKLSLVSFHLLWDALPAKLPGLTLIPYSCPLLSPISTE